MRTVATIVAGAPCRATEPLQAGAEPSVWIIAHDATITASKRDGREWSFAVQCDNQAQAEHVERAMLDRPDMTRQRRSWQAPEEDDTEAFHEIPFRLLGRRWLTGWEETSDRIAVTEGASGAVYIAVIVDGAPIGERRIPHSQRSGAAETIDQLRRVYPTLWVFDFRPVRAA